MKTRVQFRLRVYRDEEIAIGPVKVALMEAIAATGSISPASREMVMSYRRAWLLAFALNSALKSPAVHILTGVALGGCPLLAPLRTAPFVCQPLRLV